MLLKISSKNHFIAALSIFVLTTGHFILLVAFNFYFGIIMICSIVSLLFVISGIYLHLEYWFINRHEKYIIRIDSISRFKNKKEEIYYPEDIKKIILYGSATLFEPWFHLSAMEQYHFAHVFLKNGKTLTITCLLTPRVDNALGILKGVRIEKKRGLFNSIFLHTN